MKGLLFMQVKIDPPIKVMAMVHSKKNTSEPEEVTLVSKESISNGYVCKTKDGILCTAIFNYFTGLYYADDLYGVIE